MTAWQGIPRRWNPLHNKPLSREKKPSSPGNRTGVQVNHRPVLVMEEYSEAGERNNQIVRRSGPGAPATGARSTPNALHIFSRFCFLPSVICGR